MASMTMTAASFLTAGSASTIAKPSTSSRRSLVVAKAAARAPEGETKKEESSSSSGRRDLIFAAAAAAACSLAKAALADEPKRGSKEAKEKYAPVCVTMPTARICRN
ncbi:photosystem II 5 kDa protein [Pyrus ussuriensis x Pyrus communis]|uniref:Photosystem II 5 kDa protein n=1 Tax=Pyrus ussuriensis x Pyrus communis TaxID=2448454 RepID=A0A5N5FYE6_9ROSA|nr:photosystem II 5 kDa protein, chloroplastic-like [Pyrus x bretschneideri]KAB2606182.1 photosystem II 5 kDa protein [Pyrus ussuriensis x Pyrus communis]